MGVSPIKLTGEKITMVFSELFSIRFDHPSFENANEKFIWRELQITPDKETATTMMNYQLLLRWDSNRLVCFMQTSPANPPNKKPRIPFIKLPTGFKLRFLVKGSANFLSHTYIVGAGKSKTYQFTNTINHQIPNNVWLFNAVDFYSTARDYSAGTLVQDSSTYYTTKRDVLAADGISLSNVDYWLPLDAVNNNEPVVNNDDLADNTTVKADEPCLAVIDIVKTGAIDPKYEIFDGTDRLFDPAPSFIIAFKRIK